MTVEIIIPNYNGVDLLKKNLPRVLEFVRFHSASITIIDDRSTDGSVEYIKNQIRQWGAYQNGSGLADKNQKNQLKLIKNKKNLGFSSAINTGAFSSDADILVFLNTDVVPEKGFLSPIIEDFKKDKKLFGVGCMDKSIEGNRCVLRGRGIGRWQRGFLVHSRGEVDKNNTLWVSGGSSAIKRKIFVDLGGFDRLYDPFYWEDIDLCWRAQKAGYTLLFEKKSIVVHKHLEGSIKKHYGEFRIKTIAFRNQFIFIWKNITDRTLLLSHFIWLPFHLLTAVGRFDVPFVLGFFLALSRFPVIIKKRLRQRKILVKTDKEILEKFKEEQ